MREELKRLVARLREYEVPYFQEAYGRTPATAYAEACHACADELDEIISQCAIETAQDSHDNGLEEAANWLDGSPVDSDGRLILTRSYIVSCIWPNKYKAKENKNVRA